MTSPAARDAVSSACNAELVLAVATASPAEGRSGTTDDMAPPHPVLTTRKERKTDRGDTRMARFPGCKRTLTVARDECPSHFLIGGCALLP